MPSRQLWHDVGTKEEIHPFCLTPEGKEHGACTGGCVDVNLHNYINKKIDGVTINIEAECIAIERSWTPPVYPKCLNQKGENVYAVGGGINCTQYKCNNFDV